MSGVIAALASALIGVALVAVLGRQLIMENRQLRRVDRELNTSEADQSAKKLISALEETLANFMHRRAWVRMGVDGRSIQVKFLRRPAIGRWIARSSAQRLTGLAVLLAGGKRSSLRDEWRSHLAGETGRGLPAGQRIRAALGFLVAAVRYRLQDAVGIGWQMAEAVLKSRHWSNVVVFGPTGIAAIIILRHDGAAGMLASYESVAAIGGSLYAVIRVGRWYRDVMPPEPKARIKE